jgi:hypothetical protein
VAVPDLLGAIIAYARAQAAISALTGTRISGTLQEAWTMPTRAIVVNGPRGGPVNADPPIRRTRLDLECYGTTPLTSKQLAETVVGVFVPPGGASATFRSTNAAVSVGRVELEAEPLWVPDPDTGWPRTIVPLIVNWTAIV